MLLKRRAIRFPGCLLSIQRFNTRTHLYANSDAFCPTRPRTVSFLRRPRTFRSSNALLVFSACFVAFFPPHFFPVSLSPISSLSSFVRRLWFICYSERRFDVGRTRSADECHTLMICLFLVCSFARNLLRNVQTSEPTEERTNHATRVLNTK